jgi:hypothetical protein
MKIRRMSELTGKVNEMDIPLSPEEFVTGELRRKRGEMVQVVYPQLNADQREFLLTGITAEEWESMFGDGTEGEE